MAYIPTMIMIVDDAIPNGQVDVESPDVFGKITSCYNCGGIIFYQLVSRVDATEHATDTEIYCARCGKNNGGYYNDPFNEMNLSSEQSKIYKEEN